MNNPNLAAALDAIYWNLPTEDDRIYPAPSAMMKTETLTTTVECLIEQIGDSESANAALDAALDAAADKYPGYPVLRASNNPNFDGWVWTVPHWDKRPEAESASTKRDLITKMIDAFEDGTYPTR